MQQSWDISVWIKATSQPTLPSLEPCQNEVYNPKIKRGIKSGECQRKQMGFKMRFKDAEEEENVYADKYEQRFDLTLSSSDISSV